MQTLRLLIWADKNIQRLKTQMAKDKRKKRQLKGKCQP